MAHEMDTETAYGFHVDRFAQVIERTGLAIMGALCRFFVAELVAKANIVEINSVGILFSVILYGSVGSLFGNQRSFVAFGAPYCALSDGGSVPSISPLALVSAAGTFPRRHCGAGGDLYDRG